MHPQDHQAAAIDPAPAPAGGAEPPGEPRGSDWLAPARGPLRGETSPGVTVHWLFLSDTVAVTRWRCLEHDPKPRGPKHQLWHAIGFLHGGSFRMRDASTLGVADITRLVFFNPRAPYETSHPCGCGDRGGCLVLRDDLARSLVGQWDAAAAERDSEALFRPVLAPGEPRLHLELLALLRQLGASPPGELEALRVEETAIGLAARAVLRLARLAAGARPRRARLADVAAPGAGSRDDRIVAVQELLWRRLTAQQRLTDLAAEVGISAFQLCRQFRAATGSTVHRYLTRLRLGQALELLENGGGDDLSGLAFDLGFSSHSHFTCAFRSEFGVTPSAFRAAARSR